MYFVLDAIIIILLGIAIWASLRKGLTGHCLFDIIKTIIAFAGGIGACVGVYFVMNKFGWLDLLADSVVGFFGNVSTNIGGIITQENLIFASKIIAFLPFGILSLILGYIIVYKLVELIFKFITVPLKKARGNMVWKVIDNILGLCVNLAFVGGIILGVFGFIHAANTGDNYKNVLGTDTLPAIVAGPINQSVEASLTSAHETISAAPLSGFVYEINPLNSIVEDVYNSIFGK